MKQDKVTKIVSSNNVPKKRKKEVDTGDKYQQGRSQVSTSINKAASQGRSVNSHRLQTNHTLEYRGELLFGIYPVYLALLKKKRKFHQLFITQAFEKDEEIISHKNASHRKEIMNLAASLNIPMRSILSKELRYLVPDAVHQGVCLDVSHIQLLEWKENVTNIAPNEFPVWLVLEEILDPMNVGAIIRSAYYFGVTKIFTVRGNSCKISPTVSKASSGAVEVMDIYQIENLEYFIKIMVSQNWNIVSTKPYNGSEAECEKFVNVLDFKLRGPTILVLGNEGRGVSPNIQTLCKDFISIYPPHTLHIGIDSLNVSVATGVILHCLFNSWKDRLK